MSADLGRRAQEEALEDSLRALQREIDAGEEALYDLARRFHNAQDDAYGIATRRGVFDSELKQQFGHHQHAFLEAKRAGEDLLDQTRADHERVHRELAVLRDTR